MLLAFCLESIILHSLFPIFDTVGSSLLHGLFNEHSPLARFEAKLRHLQALHGLITAALPNTLRAYCHSVYWSEKTLMVNMINSAAMSKVHQLRPRLIQALQENGVDVTEIKPVMFFVHTEPKRSKAQHMTSAAIKAFQALEQNVSDPQLKETVTALLNAHTQKDLP